MRRATLMIVTLLSTTLLWGERSTDSQEFGITIYKDQHPAADGKRHGLAYWAENGNDYSIQLSIELTGQKNVVNGIVYEPIIIYPGQMVFLGIVSQDDIRKEYQWRYRWEVKSANPKGQRKAPTRSQVRQEAADQGQTKHAAEGPASSTDMPKLQPANQGPIKQVPAKQ